MLLDAACRSIQLTMRQERTMKTIGSLSLAAALLAGTMAMAQTPPPNDSGSGNSNSDIMQNNAPANNTPSKATDEGGATPQSVAQACHKQASDKQLTAGKDYTLR
jgi:hypothetical protein